MFEAGRPIHLDGGPEAVLLLHGWTGWPARIASLANALAEAGYTVDLPRLPGHGTRMTDLLQTSARDWMRRALDAYLDLRRTHDAVYVAGTSMGAIMATILAAKYGIPRVALLAPALLTRNPFLPFSPLMKHFIRKLGSDWSPESEINPLSREIGREYGSYTSIPMVAELYRMQRWGRKALRRLSSDTLVIVSEKDGSVPPAVVEYIRTRRAGGAFRELVLTESNHQLGDNVEKDKVAQAVVSWFSERL